MSITLRQLRQVQVLARHRSFRLAAQNLNISQPALSRSIQLLEEHLGYPLFDRLSTGIEPTPLGLLVLDKGESILRESNALEREVNALLGLQTGRLKIACGPYPGDRLVPLALARLSQRYPDLFCGLREIDWSEASGLLLSGHTDIVFADYDAIESDPRFAIEPLLKGRFYYICRPDHPLAALDHVSLEAAAQYPLASNRAPPRFSSFFSEGPQGRFSKDGAVFLPKIEAPTLGGTRLLLKASDCLSLAPLSVVHQDIRQGKLALLRTPPLPVYMRSGLISLSGRTASPITEAFRQEIRLLLSEEQEEVAKLATELGLEGWQAAETAS